MSRESLPMTNGKEKSTSKEADGTVAFDYIKSAQFRSIHADGAIGGPTPNGQIHLAFYSERPSIPRRIVQRIDSKGALGEEVPSLRESRNSIVREMDVDVFLSLPVAKSFHQWLGTVINDLQAEPKKAGE